mmetsp:Transcript_24114/g.55687  ORF Transcript_24114/g.55687 Transcript_24114/m.55687 type:complete len:224 (+) Transcript_24114:186-857(+)
MTAKAGSLSGPKRVLSTRSPMCSIGFTPGSVRTSLRLGCARTRVVALRALANICMEASIAAFASLANSAASLDFSRNLCASSNSCMQPVPPLSAQGGGGRCSKSAHGSDSLRNRRLPNLPKPYGKRMWRGSWVKLTSLAFSRSSINHFTKSRTTGLANDAARGLRCECFFPLPNRKKLVWFVKAGLHLLEDCDSQWVSSREPCLCPTLQSLTSPTCASIPQAP